MASGSLWDSQFYENLHIAHKVDHGALVQRYEAHSLPLSMEYHLPILWTQGVPGKEWPKEGQSCWIGKQGTVSL